MAIAKIKCLRIIGLQDKFFDVADALVNTQSFQPDDPLNFHSDIKMFIPVQAANPYSDTIDKFYSAVDSCSITHKLVDVSKRSIDDKVIQSADKLADKLNEFADKQLKLESDIGECSRSIEQIEHFLDLDLEIDKINEQDEQKKRKTLPKINVDPTLVTPISI